MAAVVISAGDRLVVNVPIKNVGTAIGNFVLKGQIVNKGNVTVGNFTAQGTSNQSPSLQVQPGLNGDFAMEKLNWANGDPYGFNNLEMLDVVWEVQVIETGLVTQIRDVDAIQHFRGEPIAQFLARTYTVIHP